MKKILFLAFINLNLNVFADGINSLNKFLIQKNISADFNQQVKTGNRVQTSQGTMQIERPNKFRWQYSKDGQLILSDGIKVYIYDEPLKQVTVRKLNQTLGKSPASLLSGGNNIKNDYKITNVPNKKDGLQWVLLMPKEINDNNGFKQVLIAFDQKDQLNQMKFIDSFGYESNLTFLNVKTPKNFIANNFKFIVPKDVDVLEQ